MLHRGGWFIRFVGESHKSGGVHARDMQEQMSNGSIIIMRSKNLIE